MFSLGVQQVIRTNQGQVIQVQNATPGGQTVVQTVGGQAVVQAAAAPQTVQIPGLGAVQVMNPLSAATATQFAAGGQNAQVINAAPAQFAAAAAPQTQTALQQDPNDPNKWHVVQVATAQAAQPAAQTAQIVTANGAILGSATIPATATAIPASEVSVNIEAPSTSNASSMSNGQQPTKTRLRRVACTCPNCRDGDRSRGK